MSNNPSRSRKFDLPVVVDPPRRVCVQIEVPDDPAHWSAFWGALDTLCLGYAWADDSAHTAREVIQVWRKVIEAAAPNNCAQPISVGADEGVEQMIRQNPDNPCLLESSIDGVHWCAFADLSKCLPAPSQPGVGAEQPAPGGGCVTYQATLVAQGQWLVPTLVSTGDTIQLVNPVGATNDGGTVKWWCPDGIQFVAGVCVGAVAFDGGDPVPTAGHMSVIALINGTYYPLSESLFTVPAGISNEQVVLQVNDSDLSNNKGTINMGVTVCNNSAGTWSHTFNFVTGQNGWLPIATGVGDGAVYTAGVGFEDTRDNFGANNYRGVLIHRAVSPSSTITSITVNYSRTAGTVFASGDFHNIAYNAGIHLINTPIQNDPANPYAWIGSQGGVTDIQVVLYCGNDNTGSDPGGTLTVTSVTVNGTGANPFA